MRVHHGSDYLQHSVQFPVWDTLDVIVEVTSTDGRINVFLHVFSPCAGPLMTIRGARFGRTDVVRIECILFHVFVFQCLIGQVFALSVPSCDFEFVPLQRCLG